MRGMLTTMAAAALFGCGPAGECPKGGTGTLVFRADAPASLAGARVTVTRPDGTSTRLEAPEAEWTFAGMAGGPWVVKAIDALFAPGAADGLVREAYAATPDPATACVRNGQTTVVKLALRPAASSDRLWTAAPLQGLHDGAELATGSGPPGVTPITRQPAFTNPRAFAFDRGGNAWVGDGVIYRVSEAAMGSSDPVPADVVIGGAAIDDGVPGVVALAFDPEGNLWAGIGFSRKVLKFTRDQLAVSGEPAPALELSGLADGVGALAFDGAGRLWVASGSLLIRFGATGQRERTLSLATAGLEAIAFDRHQNLWVASLSSNVIARVSPAELAGTGPADVTPSVQLTIDAGALLYDIAFDESGSLWFSYQSGKLGRYREPTLGSSGAKSPDLIVTSPALDSAVEAMAFFPAPLGLPLHHAAR